MGCVIVGGQIGAIVLLLTIRAIAQVVTRSQHYQDDVSARFALTLTIARG